MADIKKIQEKLAALLARARDAGSSDAEVDACMARAEKLMAEYGVTEADLDNATSADFKSYQYDVAEGRKAHDPILRYLAPYVGKMCGVTFYIDGSYGMGNRSPIIAFGMEADVEYATWLILSLRQFMDAQWQDYKNWELGACSRRDFKKARIGFVHGFCDRIKERIREMTYRNESGTGVGTGTDIVAKKTDLVRTELEQRLGGKLGRGSSLAGRGVGSAQAKGAGYTAGGGASLGRGVGQSSIAIGKG